MKKFKINIKAIKYGIPALLCIGWGSYNLCNSTPISHTLPPPKITATHSPPAWILKHPITKEDTNCLAKTIYFEGRGEPIIGQYAVAEVVMYRASHASFPSTLCKVVSEGSNKRGKRCAFSWKCDGKSDKIKDKETFAIAKRIAVNVTNPKYQPHLSYALYYHATYVHPTWSKGKTLVSKIGKHLFYI